MRSPCYCDSTRVFAQWSAGVCCCYLATIGGDIVFEVFLGNELLFSRCHILDFQLWPLVPVKDRKRRARLFGGLELPDDFCRRERVIDAITPVAKLLDLF